MTKKITRRDFIKKSAISLAAISIPNITLPGTAAAAANPKVLVVVQLIGGLDPLLMFPLTANTTELNKIRAVGARIEPGNINIQLQSGLGIHPAFNQLASNGGYPNYLNSMKVIMQTGNAYLFSPSQSHELAAQFMATGGVGDVSSRVGWTARLFDNGINLEGFNGTTPMFNCETCATPPLLTNTYENIAIPANGFGQGLTAQESAENGKYVESVIRKLSGYKTIKDGEEQNSDPVDLKPNRHISEVEEFYRKSQRKMFHSVDRLAGLHGVTGTLSASNRSPLYSDYAAFAPAMDTGGNGTDYGTLANQFRNMAQHIQEMKNKGDSSKIIFVLSMGGFDLHDRWLPSGSNLMNTLAGSLNIFLKDISNMGMFDDLAMFFCSEFGRTSMTGVQGVGSDHGIGYTSFVIGGKVNGGVYGHVYTPQELLQRAQTGLGAVWPREIAQERIIAEILDKHLVVKPELAFPGDFLSKVPQAPGLNLFK